MTELRNPFKVYGKYTQRQLILDLRQLVDDLNKDKVALADEISALESRIAQNESDIAALTP